MDTCVPNALYELQQIGKGWLQQPFYVKIITLIDYFTI